MNSICCDQGISFNNRNFFLVLINEFRFNDIFFIHCMLKQRTCLHFVRTQSSLYFIQQQHLKSARMYREWWPVVSSKVSSWLLPDRFAMFAVVSQFTCRDGHLTQFLLQTQMSKYANCMR